jgi:hypothetical protein
MSLLLAQAGGIAAVTIDTADVYRDFIVRVVGLAMARDATVTLAISVFLGLAQQLYAIGFAVRLSDRLADVGLEEEESACDQEAGAKQREARASASWE